MNNLPWYSHCCQSPILGDAKGHRMYCHKCGKTIRSFAGKRREKVMATIAYERSQCMVRAMLLGENIAYARDVPNLVWRDGGYRKVGRSSYKFFIQGSSLVSAMGLQQCQTVDGFETLKAAATAMRRVLV